MPKMQVGRHVVRPRMNYNLRSPACRIRHVGLVGTKPMLLRAARRR